MQWIKPSAEQKLMFKLIVYVPETHKESLKDALFEAGAGQLGAYARCAWETLGTGQFCPSVEATPYIGVVGALERVSEWRVETLVDESVWPDVKAALYQSHPYEEPAFDLIQVLDVTPRT
jgi:hypothetical protein